MSPPHHPPSGSTSLRLVAAGGQEQVDSHTHPWLVAASGDRERPNRMRRKNKDGLYSRPSVGCRRPSPSPQQHRRGLLLPAEGETKDESQHVLLRLTRQEPPSSPPRATAAQWQNDDQKSGWLAPPSGNTLSDLPGQGNINSAGGAPFGPSGVLEFVLRKNSRADQPGREGRGCCGQSAPLRGQGPGPE